MRHKPHLSVAVSAVIASAAMGLAGLVPTAVAAVVARRPAAPAAPVAPPSHQLTAVIPASPHYADPNLTVTTVRS